MVELIIDNKNVEIGDSSLVFSKVGRSYDDWLSINIPYSERVTLPETSILNSLFKRPDSPHIKGDKFSKYYEYKYKEDGTIVSSGIAKMLEFSSNREYEIQLIDSSYILFSNLENSINTIGVDQYDFIFNSASYASLKTLTSSIWLWAAASTHENKEIGFNILSGILSYSRPFFSIKRLVEKILSNNGWTYDLGTYAELFDKLIISSNTPFYFTSYEKKFNATLSAGSLVVSSPDFVKNDSPGTNIINLAYDCNFRLRGNIVADNDFTLTLQITGTPTASQEFVINKGSYDYDFTSIDLKSTNFIEFILAGTGNVQLNDFYIYTIIDENTFGNFNVVPAPFEDFKVKTYDNMPDVSQLDLLKHCLVPIAGFTKTSNFDKKITINSLKVLNNFNIKDLSDKFIEATESVNSIEDYGQLNLLSYAKAENKSNLIGRGSFNIDNPTLPDIVTFYDSIFEASGEVTITDIMLDNTIYGFDGSVYNRINEVGTLLAYYENVSDYTVARFSQLNGTSILTNYYSKLIEAIQRGEVTTAEFNLNKSDYFTFDFTKLVYISQKKSNYICVAMSNYSRNQPTELILLKT